MGHSKSSQPAHKNISFGVSASAADGGMSNCGQTHWIPSGTPRHGDEYVDLLCHELVRITPQTPTFAWRNDSFYFCSTFCRQRFAQAPDEFLAARDIHDVTICNGSSHAAA